MADDARLRVLMVGPRRSGRGGMATVVNGYYSAGIQDMVDLTYVGTTSAGGPFFKGIAALRALWRFWELLPSSDVVHVHIGAGISFQRKRLFVKMARFAKKPIVLHEHRGVLATQFGERGERFRTRNRNLVEDVDAAIVLSDGWRDFYTEHICSSSKVAVLPNSVAVQKECSYSFASKIVLFLGHMTNVKGPDILIRAIPSVLREVPAARFVMAGDGESGPYAALAAQLGVSKAVDFVGWVDDVAKVEWLERSSLYVQPSRGEGMPMGLLEAMATGVPVVATAVGGTPEVVEDGVDGFLVPVESPDELASRIVELLVDQELSARFSQEAHVKIQKKFNAEVGVHRLVALYTRVKALKGTVQ